MNSRPSWAKMRERLRRKPTLDASFVDSAAPEACADKVSDRPATPAKEGLLKPVPEVDGAPAEPDDQLAEPNGVRCGKVEAVVNDIDPVDKDGSIATDADHDAGPASGVTVHEKSLVPMAEDVQPKPLAGKPGNAAPWGRVISVSGSVVWGVFDIGADHAIEIGDLVRLVGGTGRSFGIVTTLKRDGRRVDDERRLVEIKLLGEVPDDTESFQCGVSKHPALDSPIYVAERDELLLIYRQPNVAAVRLGTLRQAEDLPAYAVTDQLLGKHFAILGTTGAGKSCAVTVLLRAILESNPFGHIVMLDPHNEYGHAFGERAELLNPSTLKLPYWLLNFEELSEVLVNRESAEASYAESAILRDALLRVRKMTFANEADSDHVTVDTPIPYRLSDLIGIIKEDMGAFNRADSVAPFQHLISRIERITSDRRFAFMFSSFMVQDSMAQVLSSILRLPVNGKPVTIIDLSGMPSEIVDVVVSVLLRLVFEFALWTDRKKAPPILLVCEEAHRYVPRDDDAAFAPTKRAISRIAKEGRKYGLSLGLVTQRPAELSVSSLSQCNTMVALRMSNEHDLSFVQHAIPENSRWLVETMPSLNTREAVVVGAGVAVPMHIRFDELSPEHRPASTTPPFSKAWQEDVNEPDLVTSTIDRWRHQRRDYDV